MMKEVTWRYTMLGVILTAIGIFVVVQILRIQTSPQAKVFRQRGESQSGNMRLIRPPRGEIYDRWGHLLAGNSTVYEVGVDLSMVENPGTIAMALNGVVGSNYEQVFALASQEPSEKAIYAVLADYVTEEQKTRLEQFSAEISKAYGNAKTKERPSLAGLSFYPHLQRAYPEKDLASNILGFVRWDGIGVFGIEEQFNDLLSAPPRQVWFSLDPNKVEEQEEIPPAASLILTIDRAIQSEVEDILDKAIIESGSQNGTILVTNPRSGEILAIAVTPRMDLNEFWDFKDIYEGETPFNRAVSKAYEPGSVYKVLTMATALDSGAVTPHTEFLDTGSIEIGGAFITNWNGGAWGPQDMLGCMQHSLNVCLAWVATQIGAKDFYRYMQEFGIGHLTGIDLAYENPGRLKHPGDGDWYEADLGTNSFGQGVSATPIQMVTAISAVANDGKMVAPRIVLSMIENGRQYNTIPQVVATPISPETAHTLTEMLATSLEIEASDAQVEGYRVAGKTGTAEIPTPTGYTSGQTNASFVGWGPVDDPQFLVYVWLEKPSASPWGSVVASPVFRQVVERLVVLMNIPPDEVRERLLESQ